MLQNIASRIQHLGGTQLDRIKQQKLRSLQAALKNDYNSYLINTPLRGAYQCLMNADRLDPDYDKKIVSVSYDSGLSAGDVYVRLLDDTRWMIYLPVVTEIAYLRSQVIRCRYTIEIDGETYWVYLRGAHEDSLSWVKSSGVEINTPNVTARMFIKSNEQTRDFFKRFTKLKVGGQTWQVQVTDAISAPGILEVDLLEYFSNKHEDLPEILPAVPGKENEPFRGPDVVRQNVEIGFAIQEKFYSPGVHWSVDGNPRVKVLEEFNDGRLCKIKVHEGAVGEFIVHYGSYSKTVAIKWQEELIQGPVVVYPYGTYVYKLNVENAHNILFRVSDEKIARILSTKDNECQVQIKTGRSGKFILTATYGSDKSAFLSIDIKSL